MYWLVTYSQRSSLGHQILANAVIKGQLGVWLANMIEQFPEDCTLLHFATKIDEQQYESLKEKL